MKLQLQKLQFDKEFIACGDIHGKFEELVYKLKEKKVTDAVVIVAGDCGLGFHKKAYYEDLYKRKLEPKLKKLNTVLILVRGNHDNPAYFDNKTINYDYMIAVEDYTIIEAKKDNKSASILCIGGAISIDREWRLDSNKILEQIHGNGDLAPRVYWENEASLGYFSIEHILSNYHFEEQLLDITHILSHDTPHVPTEWTSKMLYIPDKGTARASAYNVENMLTIGDRILRGRIRNGQNNHYEWIHGHYHISDKYKPGITQIKSLGIMELY